MITTELIDLLELARSLVSRKAELDKSHFEQFIEPVWDSFVRVHQDYKKSFREYAQVVFRENFSTEDLLERIRSDSINTADIRIELSKLIKYLPQEKPFSKDVLLSKFALKISEYFDAGLHTSGTGDATAVFSNSEFTSANGARYRAIIYLSRKRNQLDFMETIEFFQDLVIELQSRYEEVADAYYHLKKELLT